MELLVSASEREERPKMFLCPPLHSPQCSIKVNASVLLLTSWAKASILLSNALILRSVIVRALTDGLADGDDRFCIDLGPRYLIFHHSSIHGTKAGCWYDDGGVLS